MEFSYRDIERREIKNYLNNFGWSIVILWSIGILCVYLDRIDLGLCFILLASVISTLMVLMFCVKKLTQYEYPNSDEVLRLVGN